MFVKIALTLSLFIYYTYIDFDISKILINFCEELNALSFRN